MTATSPDSAEARTTLEDALARRETPPATLRPDTPVADRLDALCRDRHLPLADWQRVLAEATEADRHYAAALAREAALHQFGTAIYMRALLEISNHCKNNCYYCGIRAGNRSAARYRLDDTTILTTADHAYALGYRTLVMQGGEDPAFTRSRVVGILRQIRERHPDMAVTLSIGERSHEDYAAFFEAGADRYLLRHETADPEHYASLHPPALTLAHRIRCLEDLRAIGYQVGCGFMVGSPGQTAEQLAQDFAFIERLRPHMVGIGPFIPHAQTPLRDEPAGSFTTTLFCLSLLRLLHPALNLPATTAMGTIHPYGRELAILAGANVLMPNITPPSQRELYTLYNRKITRDDDADPAHNDLARRLDVIGYRPVTARGDYDPEPHGEDVTTR